MPKQSENSWNEVTAARRCTICTKDTWCSYTTDGNATICRRIDDGTGEHRIDEAGQDYWLYRAASPVAPDLSPPPVDVSGVTRAADLDLDRVHRALLSSLVLIPSHREELSRRGMTDAEIDLAGYRSLPIKGRKALASVLVRQFGDSLCAAIPGLYVKQAGSDRWWSIAGAAGIVIPCRNAAGLIVALKVRADDPAAGTRYSYVSSRRHGGPGPGAQVHVPIIGHHLDGPVRATEGELKADIATARGGTLTISAPGVSAWRRLIPVLKQLGATEARLAFDADRETKPQVERALRAAAEQLSREGFKVSIESWPIEQGKGIDDVLVAGHVPAVTPVAAQEPESASAADKPEVPIDVRLRELRRGKDEDWSALVLRLDREGILRDLAAAVGKRRRCLDLAAQALGLAEDEKKDLRDAVAAVCAEIREEERDAGARDPKPAQADYLVEIGKEAELFHDDADEPYAVVTVDGHREVHPLRSKAFAQWLTREYYDRHGKACGDTPLADALRLLSANARFKRERRPVHLRVCRHEETCWYDLADPEWRAVRIDPQGWSIVTTPPVLFRRHANTSVQVEPKRGGTLDLLRQLLHLHSERDWQLIVTWLIAAMISGTPRCILALSGEQGSAKSTTAKVLRRLIDPAKAETIRLSRKPEEFAQAVAHSWMTVLDNLSRVSDDQSDAICSAVTGDGYSKRALYTDDDDKILQFMRVFVLTGIGSFLDRPDALDRTLIVRLRPFEPGEVKDEETFWGEFEAVRSLILGALLGAVAGCLRELPAVSTPPGFRMADFCRIGVAVEKHLGFKPGSFVAAMNGNAEAQVEEVLETSVVAGPLREFGKRRGEWGGTASDLLRELNAAVGMEVPKQPGWPKNSAQLGTLVVRLAPALRRVGLAVEHGIRTAGGSTRLIKIRARPQPVVTDGSDEEERRRERDALQDEGHREEGSAE